MTPHERETEGREDSAAVSETHRLLARMLARQRDPEAHARIDAIISSGVSAHEQVRMIRELDRESDRREAGAHPAPEPNSPSTDESRSRSEPTRSMKPREVSAQLGGIDLVPVSTDRRQEMMRRRALLRRPVGRIGVWSYLRTHRHRVVSFARTARFLKTGLLALRVRLDRDSLRRMRSFAGGPLRALREVLDSVLLDGWRELPKYDYNLLVVLHSLVRNVEQVGFPDSIRNESFPIRRYAQVERDFLLLVREDPEAERCIAALQRHFRWASEDTRRNLERHITTMRQLLQRDMSRPTFLGMLVALAIVSYGRYVTLDDLLNRESGDLVDREQFDCDLSVRRRIEEHIAAQVSRIEPLVTQLREVVPDRTAAHQRAARIDPATLRRFAGLGVEESNVVVQAARISEAIASEWGPLLDGHVVLAGGNRAAVFDRACFGTEMGRLGRVAESLDRVRGALPSFPRGRFDQLQHSSADASALEREAVRQVDELATQAVQIGRKVARIELNRCPSAGCAESETLPLGPGALTRRFYAPDLDQFMAGPIPLAGQTVADALSRIAALALYIGHYFHEKSTRAEAEREHRIRDELGTLLANLRRVAHRSVYERIIDRWPILVTEKVNQV